MYTKTPGVSRDARTRPNFQVLTTPLPPSPSNLNLGPFYIFPPFLLCLSYLSFIILHSQRQRHFWGKCFNKDTNDFPQRNVSEYSRFICSFQPGENFVKPFSPVPTKLNAQFLKLHFLALGFDLGSTFN